MNKLSKYLNKIVAVFTVILICSACDDSLSDLPIEEENKGDWHTCELVLSTEDGTRAEGQTPRLATGDVLFIQFGRTGQTYINGIAKYDQATGKWEITYKGELIAGKEDPCSVYYLGNHPSLSASSSYVELSPYNPLYKDTGARYVYDGEKIHLIAKLSCMTARLKFISDAPSSFEMKGLSYINYLSFSYVEFRKSPAYNMVIPIELNPVGDRYESDYIYVLLPDGYLGLSDSRIWIKSGNEVYVYNTELMHVIGTGKSGVVTIPTPDSHEGWNMDTYKEKTFANVSVTTSASADGWSQTQNSHRFESKTGVFITYDYMLTGRRNDTNYPEFYNRWDSDGEGPFINLNNGAGEYEDRTQFNEVYYFAALWYQPDASYYYVQFFNNGISYKISDITMSNF